MKVSVILPTYNEAENIVTLIRAVRDNVPAPWDYEIIVVDDNSPDHTVDAVKAAFPDDPRVRTILRTADRGLANSIRCGLEAATGDQGLVMDTDFNHDPKEIGLLLHVGRMSDIVTGSRFCAGGNMQNHTRYLFSLFYNWGIRLLLNTQIQDNLSGFFTISMVKLRQLPFDRIFFGYGDYFFRLLHYAQKHGFKIIETPCYYRDRTKGVSKTNFLPTFLRYTKAALKCRLAARGERGRT